VISVGDQFDLNSVKSECRLLSDLDLRGRKELQGALGRLAGIPETVSRVVLATGRYIGEGFDDSRLDTLFLTLPVSW